MGARVVAAALALAITTHPAVCAGQTTSKSGTLTRAQQLLKMDSLLQRWGREMEAEGTKVMTLWGGYAGIAQDTYSTTRGWTYDSVPLEEHLQKTYLQLGELFESASAVSQSLKASAEDAVKLGSFTATYWDSEGFHGKLMPGNLNARTPVFKPSPRSFLHAAHVSEQHSSVRVSTRARRDDSNVIDFIQWSKRMNPAFFANQLVSSEVLYQYVSSHGALRQYPGRRWPHNTIGLPAPYNVEEREWFTSVGLGPADTVVVLDTSGSMRRKGAWKKAKEMLRKVLMRVSADDSFAVVLAGQAYTDRRERAWWRPDSDVLGCQADRLQPGTASRKHAIMKIVDLVFPRGGTNFTQSFATAKMLLDSGSSCAKALIVISDGPHDASGRDPGAHCGKGYYRTADGRWQEPEFCASTHVGSSYSNPFATLSTVFGDDEVAAFHYMMVPEKLKRRTFDRTVPENETVSVGDIFTDEDYGDETDVTDYYVSPYATCRVQVWEVASMHDADAGARGYAEWRQTVPVPKDEAAETTPQATQRWSTPYLDAFGSSRMIITLSQPYYFQNRLHGVVGIDFSIDSMRNVLRQHQTDHVYFTLISDNGEAIIHPYLDAASVYFPLIDELEDPHNTVSFRESSNFVQQVMTVMLGGQTEGQVSIAGPVREYLGEDKTHGYNLVTKEKTYRWLKLSGVPFFLCMVYHSTLATKAPSVPTIPNSSFPSTKPLFHRVDLYDSNVLLAKVPTAKAERDVNGTTSRVIVKGYVGYYLRRECFCDTNEYVSDANFTRAHVEAIDRLVYGTDVSAGCQQARPGEETNAFQVLPECVADIRYGALLAEVNWKPQQVQTLVESFDDQALVSRAYVTMKRNMVTVPAGAYSRLHDPTTATWYRAAVQDPSALHFTSPMTVPLTGRSTIMVSQAVMQGKDEHYVEVKCDTDDECADNENPAVCIKALRLCSSRLVAGVNAVELDLAKWKDFFKKRLDVLSLDVHQTFTQGMDSTQQLEAQKYQNLTRCGVQYNCPADNIPGYTAGQNVTCETRCYAVDSAGIVLYNSSATWPELGRVSGVHLGDVESDLMRQLTYEKNMFLRKETIVRDGRCGESESWLSRHTWATKEATDWDGTARYDEVKDRRTGQMDPRGTTCMTTSATYRLNTLQATQSGELSDGCTYGTYSASVVKGANVVVIMISSYFSRLSPPSGPAGRLPRDWGCALKAGLHTMATQPSANFTCPPYSTALPATAMDPNCTSSALPLCPSSNP